MFISIQIFTSRCIKSRTEKVLKISQPDDSSMNANQSQVTWFHVATLNGQFKCRAATFLPCEDGRSLMSAR